MNLIGLLASDPTVAEPTGRWFEVDDPQHLRPANLHEAQLARRLGMDR